MTHPTHSVASNAEPAALSESGQVDRHKAPEGGRHEPLVSPLPFEATLSGDVEKNDTLALVAHELRDPLGAISAALVLLDRRLGRECVRERAIIRRQVDTLVRLVEDLLDATRIARDGVSLHREYVPLRDVLARALEITAPLRHTSHHRLHARLPSAAVLVYADSMRLAQVFSNLLSNAARFTPQGGCIETIFELEAGSCRVRIKDDGRGIEPDVLRHVFEPYFQGTRSEGGTPRGLGLGLAFAKAVTERHGGTVTARSDGPGLGSEFSVRLPLSNTSLSMDASR